MSHRQTIEWFDPQEKMPETYANVLIWYRSLWTDGQSRPSVEMGYYIHDDECPGWRCLNADDTLHVEQVVRWARVDPTPEIRDCFAAEIPRLEADFSRNWGDVDEAMRKDPKDLGHRAATFVWQRSQIMAWRCDGAIG